jgi:hypothetical protein
MPARGSVGVNTPHSRLPDASKEQEPDLGESVALRAPDRAAPGSAIAPVRPERRTSPPHPFRRNPSSGNATCGNGSDSNWNANGNAHSGTVFTNGLPAAGLRGGNWNYGSEAGAFSMSLGYGPSNWSPRIGSRCCRVR